MAACAGWLQDPIHSPGHGRSSTGRFALAPAQLAQRGAQAWKNRSLPIVSLGAWRNCSASPSMAFLLEQVAAQAYPAAVARVGRGRMPEVGDELRAKHGNLQAIP